MWLFLAATVGVGLAINYYFAQATVYIDNATTRDVRLALDGQPWLILPAGTNTTSVLRRGQYAVAVNSSDGGDEIDRVNVNVEDRGPYVLNTLGRQVYTRGEVQYGGVAFGDTDPQEVVRDKWFKADVDYLFVEPPQSIIVQTKGGYATASKTYLSARAREKEGGLTNGICRDDGPWPPSSSHCLYLTFSRICDTGSLDTSPDDRPPVFDLRPVARGQGHLGFFQLPVKLC